MSITVQYFAVLAEHIGLRTELIDPAPATAGALLDELADSHGIVAAMRSSIAIAVNDAYVPLDHPIASGDQVALIPPVSGG